MVRKLISTSALCAGLMLLSGVLPVGATLATAVVVDVEPPVGPRPAVPAAPVYRSVVELSFVSALDDVRPATMSAADVLAIGWETCSVLDAGATPLDVYNELLRARLAGEIEDVQLILFTGVLFEATLTGGLCGQHSGGVDAIVALLIPYSSQLLP